MNYNELLELAINAALAGGEDILKVYNTDFYVEIKSDNTPVTLADKRSSETILKMLAPSNFPIVSEEEIISNYSERKLWTHMWLVDPLDGTKEFVKRNGEFSVNIALILNGSPVIGVIYAPVKKTIYFDFFVIKELIYLILFWLQQSKYYCLIQIRSCLK